LIKLERRIPPKAVKFEDVKESLREQLQSGMLQATIKEMRSDLQKETQRSLKILDPTLAKQYTDRITDADKQLRDRDQINRELQRQRERLKLPTTQPEDLRPPASGSTAAPTPSAPAVDTKAPASPTSSPTTRP
jgi:DNA-binding transcriptional regulator GbsR (MarR family)